VLRTIELSECWGISAAKHSPMKAPTPIRIREASPDDRQFILDTARRFADFDLPSWRTVAQVVDAEARVLQKEIEEPGAASAMFIAETESSIPVGFIFIETHTDYFTQRPHAHISTISITKDAEGHGAGGALMKAAEDWARQRQLPHITLNVFDLNTRARSFYERLGYQPEIVKYFKVL
jgi:ribosomal protein S18 acetylase RimI-like enzyme